MGGIDLDNGRSVRLLTRDRRGQSPNSPLQIGDIWNIDYVPVRDVVAPHTEDVTATIGARIGTADVAGTIQQFGTQVYAGDTTALFEGRLQWTNSGRGFLEPAEATPFSTTFWRPNSRIFRNGPFADGDYSYREPATNHHIAWKGVADPPERIEPGTLCRISLAKPWPPDHPVCWLQLSGVY